MTRSCREHASRFIRAVLRPVWLRVGIAAILAVPGRVDVSPGHPLPDARRIGDLRAGNLIDGSRVASADLVPYDGGATFDLLRSGPTEIDWADGIQLAGTIAPSAATSR